MATITARRNAEGGLVGWQAKVRKRGWPSQSKTFSRKSDAERWARQVESEIERGVFNSTSDAERITFSEIAKRFATEFALAHYRKRDDNKEAWRFQIARLEEFLGDYALSAIDQRLVASYRDERLNPASERNWNAVSGSTVRKELYLLSAVFGFAEKECGLSLPRGNPASKVRKPPEGAQRERRLTSSEWMDLETQCGKSENPWLLPALRFAAETAMRQAEMLTLTWDVIEAERRMLLLGDPLKIKNNEVRGVPLSTRALKILDELPREGDRVFPITREALYYVFRGAVNRAKIKDFRWHDIRHEAVSRLAERGDMTILELAAFSGHKTLQMLKRYTHIETQKLAEKIG